MMINVVMKVVKALETNLKMNFMLNMPMYVLKKSMKSSYYVLMDF